MTNTDGYEIDTAVTAVLRAEAAAQKLTWPALAELAGVPKSTMSNYLNDVSGMKLATLDAISRALGLDILEVLARARQRMDRPPVIVTDAGSSIDGLARPSAVQPPRPQGPRDAAQRG